MKKITLILVMLVSVTLLHAQTNTQPGCYPFPKTISVVGSAELEVIPDEIYVQVDLREYKKKGEDKIDLEKIKTEFLANCRAIGVADSNISVASFDGYNMATVWRRKKKDPELLSSIAYQIKFSNTKLIDDLVSRLDDQATNNFSITKTSHSKIAEYRKQLKIKAVKAAKDKATYLTEAVNEQLGAAITITEPDESTSSDINAGRYKSNIAGVEALREMNKIGYSINELGVDYRKIRLRYEVNVLFALK